MSIIRAHDVAKFVKETTKAPEGQDLFGCVATTLIVAAVVYALGARALTVRACGN
jgi:hypothetical protein